jgi:hypothetical protein
MRQAECRFAFQILTFWTSENLMPRPEIATISPPQAVLKSRWSPSCNPNLDRKKGRKIEPGNMNHRWNRYGGHLHFWGLIFKSPKTPLFSLPQYGVLQIKLLVIDDLSSVQRKPEGDGCPRLLLINIKVNQTFIFLDYLLDQEQNELVNLIFWNPFPL